MTELRNRPAPSIASRSVPALALLLIASLAGCYQEPSRFEKVQRETRHNAPAVSKEALPGSSFNALFPKPAGGFDVVYTQEKTGFAEAKLVKKGQDVATFSIFDTRSNPEAADKYKNSQESFEGYPITEIGTMGTGVLVAGRYQVQVRSKDANFSRFDREDWLRKFDLANLAKLQ